MLLSISYDVLESLLIKLVFENEKVKRVKVEINDYVSITYNKDGKRRTIDGFVRQIYLDNRYEHYKCQHNQHWTLLIADSIDSDANQIAKVEVSKLLDIDVLKRQADSGYISTPLSDNAVTDFRLVGNTLQLSQDHGTTWVKVLDLPVEEPAIDSCDCDLASKIKSMVPNNLRADLQKELMENIAKLVQEEKDCNCDCHTPVATPPATDSSGMPIKPGCNCGCQNDVEPMYGGFIMSQD